MRDLSPKTIKDISAHLAAPFGLTSLNSHITGAVSFLAGRHFLYTIIFTFCSFCPAAFFYERINK